MQYSDCQKLQLFYKGMRRQHNNEALWSCKDALSLDSCYRAVRKHVCII